MAPSRQHERRERHCSLKATPADSSQAIELLTIPEVAELLKISVVTVRRIQERRLIPFIKVGGSVRFAKGDITAYLEKRRVESIDS
jgi:excisionase family DNA binding protein